MANSQVDWGVLGKQPNISDRTLTFKSKIEITHMCKIPCITDMCFIYPDRLVVADNETKSLLLVDIGGQEVKKILNLTSFPWGVTRLPGDQAAVTLPGQKKIQIISTLGGLSPVREFWVGGSCHGLSYCDGELLVTYWEQGSVMRYDMEGRRQKRIALDYKGDNVFTCPESFTFLTSGAQKYIYVSDWDKNTITKFTMDGLIVSQFQDERLGRPFGIVAIGDDLIAVCSNAKDKITVVRDEDGKMEIVKQWDCVEQPRAIEYRATDNTLYVSSGGMKDMAVLFVHVYTF